MLPRSIVCSLVFRRQNVQNKFMCKSLKLVPESIMREPRFPKKMCMDPMVGSQKARERNVTKALSLGTQCSKFNGNPRFVVPKSISFVGTWFSNQCICEQAPPPSLPAPRPHLLTFIIFKRDPFSHVQMPQ